VSNPEFLREGSAIFDFQMPDRLIIGRRDSDSDKLMMALYYPLRASTHKHIPFIWMSPESAELTKYAANAMLATRISFMNEIANLCEAVGADVRDVQKGVGSDHRIGPHFLSPGPGWGGSCFPKDVAALIGLGWKHSAPQTILDSVADANREQRHNIAGKILKHFSGKVEGKLFAVLGTSFKAGTDDIRCSPALTVIEVLMANQAGIVYYDPQSVKNTASYFNDKWGADVIVGHSDNGPYDALEGADALVIMTDWPEFKEADLDRVKSLLKAPVIFDARNLFDPVEMEKRGFTYYGIGLPQPGRKP
jgi:UDPglucose 6-dehydrogenase